ncbi:MAG: sulfotransferase family protein [Oceanococcus sp.]
MTHDHTLPIPNLVVLGAQKSGTTSLHHYMNQHPDIFMSAPVKEPGYFLGSERAKIFWQRMGAPIENRQQLLESRMLQGYQSEAWFGDASTYYTIGGRSRRFTIPQNMHDANPNMRFIYIMRDPVERVISNYWHCRANGTAQDGLEEFLKTTEGRIAFRTSRYQHQLEPYLELFPKEQFCLLLFEDLLERPADVMEEIWNFLKLPPLPDTKTYPRYNQSKRSNDGSKPLDDAELALIRRRLGPDIRKLKSFWGVNTERWAIQHMQRAQTRSN